MSLATALTHHAQAHRNVFNVLEDHLGWSLGDHCVKAQAHQLLTELHRDVDHAESHLHPVESQVLQEQRLTRTRTAAEERDLTAVQSAVELAVNVLPTRWGCVGLVLHSLKALFGIHEVIGAQLSLQTDEHVLLGPAL